jgi:hypothetical protein
MKVQRLDVLNRVNSLWQIYCPGNPPHSETSMVSMIPIQNFPLEQNYIPPRALAVHSDVLAKRFKFRDAHGRERLA